MSGKNPLRPPAFDVGAALAQGFHLIQQDRLPEAQALYEHVLARYPSQFDALFFLGAIAAQLGRFDEAEPYFAKAARIKPNEPGTRMAYGDILYARGQFAQALVSYNRAIALRPNIEEFHSKRGNTLYALRRFDDALISYDRCLALNPGFADAHYNRGNTLQELARWDESLASYDRAIAVNPGYAEAHYNRGIALLTLKRLEDALAAFDRAIVQNPNFVEAHYNRGITLQELMRFADALASQDNAIALRLDFAKSYSYRGIALLALGRLEAALASHSQAIALQPDNAVAYARQAATRLALRQFDAAMADYQHAIALQPDLIEARHGRGLCRLLQGDFAAGLPDYESRMALHPFTMKYPDKMLTREAMPIAGKRLLVVGDVGFGDTLHFIRYMKVISSWGVDLRIGVQPSLHRLLISMDIQCAFVDPSDLDLEFDLWVSVMSLPYLCGTDLGCIPADIPYLASEPDRREHWKKIIGPVGFKIGVCWQGAVRSEMRFRGFPVAELAPIAALPDIRLLSLHRGVGEVQLSDLPVGMRIETFGDDFDTGPHAFLDTAAVIANCDLVITCDTSVAHLAGALGARTWLALNDVPDWRWLLDRADSPWYPTMRLFRQTARDDWQGVFRDMEQALLSRLRS